MSAASIVGNEIDPTESIPLKAFSESTGILIFSLTISKHVYPSTPGNDYIFIII